MSTSSEEPKHLDSLCFRRFVMAAWVVAIVCACACPGANTLALQDIEKAYDTKLEALGRYRIQVVCSVSSIRSPALLFPVIPVLNACFRVRGDPALNSSFPVMRWLQLFSNGSKPTTGSNVVL